MQLLLPLQDNLMSKEIVLKMSEQEANVLVEIINIAVKAHGLGLVKPAIRFVDEIIDQLNSNEAPTSQNEI